MRLSTFSGEKKHLNWLQILLECLDITTTFVATYNEILDRQ
jgi:hypothetical protein